MKRTYQFVKAIGIARCALPSGETITIPVVPGILKHPSAESLHRLLTNANVARKYTCQALIRAPWSVLRQFPREWLELCMSEAPLSPSRRKALEFLLG